MGKKDIEPYFGLCSALACTDYFKTLLLFQPSEKDQNELDKNNKPSVYWGEEETGCKIYEYTRRHQTIVLFICAMHGEI